VNAGRGKRIEFAGGVKGVPVEESWAAEEALFS
jgi:hypothetical protein